MVHDPISVLDALMIALSGIVIVFLMLAFNLLGNGLRDASIQRSGNNEG